MTNELRILYDELTLNDDQLMVWQDQPFTGIAYETNNIGNIISESYFENGVMQGLSREWFDSGKLRSESYYHAGSKHGVSRSWHNNDQIEAIVEYQYSIKVYERLWRPDGVLIREWSLPENDQQRELIDLLAKRFGQ